MEIKATTRADEDRFLRPALFFTFIAHATAMVSMVLLLLPGVPGGNAVSDTARIAYVANHPLLWRLGWAGWQVTALSDLLLAAALLATAWIPRQAAVLTMVLTLAGLTPDQFGQLIWTVHGPALARAAIAGADHRQYLAFELYYFRLIAGWGAFGYLSAALGWTWCFAAAGAWSRPLTCLSVATWTVFAAAIAVLFVPGANKHPAIGTCVSIANAVAFVLLLAWIAAVTEQVLRRSRPIGATGSAAVWRHPSPRLWARGCELIANSRFIRSFFQWLPILPMASDIGDVLYVNYLVPALLLEPLLPPYLALQRLGPNADHAMFTSLTFRHGHFGPIVFGTLRKLWPSPIQSNWRIYVVDPQTGKRGIHFVTTAITSTPHALASRLLSEGVPMHVPAEATLLQTIDGGYRLEMHPGSGSAPDISAIFRRSEVPTLPRP